jgi:hypothetical protein
MGQSAVRDGQPLGQNVSLPITAKPRPNREALGDVGISETPKLSTPCGPKPAVHLTATFESGESEVNGRTASLEPNPATGS